MPEWTKISEPPETDDHCLVWHDHEIYLGWYDLGERSFYQVRYARDDERELDRATHWMPLPLPPK